MHSAIPLFNQPDFLDSNAYQALSDSERQVATQLRDHGYALLPQAIDHQLIDQIIRDCDEKYPGSNTESEKTERIANAYKFSNAVRQLAADPKIIQMLSNIYGRGAFPFQTLNFEMGTEQRTHVDTIHFCPIPNLFMTGVWVALEDVTEANGPLHYIEGSHHLPVFDCADANVPHASVKENHYKYYSRYEDFIEQLIQKLGLKKKHIHMQKGDVFIWTANLMHGGEPIMDKSSTRLSQVTHYFYEGCSYYTPLLSDTKAGKIALRLPFNIATGKRMPVIELIRNSKQQGFSLRHILRNLIYARMGR